MTQFVHIVWLLNSMWTKYFHACIHWLLFGCESFHNLQRNISWSFSMHNGVDNNNLLHWLTPSQWWVCVEYLSVIFQNAAHTVAASLNKHHCWWVNFVAVLIQHAKEENTSQRNWEWVYLKLALGFTVNDMLFVTSKHKSTGKVIIVIRIRSTSFTFDSLHVSGFLSLFILLLLRLHYFFLSCILSIKWSSYGDRCGWCLNGCFLYNSINHIHPECRYRSCHSCWLNHKVYINLAL